MNEILCNMICWYVVKLQSNRTHVLLRLALLCWYGIKILAFRRLSLNINVLFLMTMTDNWNLNFSLTSVIGVSLQCGRTQCQHGLLSKQNFIVNLSLHHMFRVIQKRKRHAKIFGFLKITCMLNSLYKPLEVYMKKCRMLSAVPQRNPFTCSHRGLMTKYCIMYLLTLDPSDKIMPLCTVLIHFCNCKNSSFRQ
jgi:hypothetical protein